MTCCAPKYTARSLREVVDIQEATRVSDGMGGFDDVWATVHNSARRAMIKAAPGSERWGFMRQQSGNTYRMVTRYFDGATAAQRVIWNSMTLGVLGVVDPDGRGQWLEWRLSDGVAS